jgi:hypothetical protein
MTTPDLTTMQEDFTRTKRRSRRLASRGSVRPTYLAPIFTPDEELVDRHYPQAECIRIVLDKLSTHTAAALYDTFEPGEARRILRRLEFHYVPKHASWLNMVEIEIGMLKQHCLARRIAQRETLEREIALWQARRKPDGRAHSVDVHHRTGTRKTQSRLPATGNHSSRSGKETSGRMNLSNSLRRGTLSNRAKFAVKA